MGKAARISKLFGGLAMLMLLISASASAAETTPVDKQPSRKDTTMKIRIALEGQEAVMATLDNSPAVLDLLKQLPLTLEFSDHAGTEKIAYPPHKLATSGVAKGYAGKAGDITYYAPWGNLAIFYRNSDVGTANGLVYLGKLDSIPAAFSQNKKVKVLITKVLDTDVLGKEVMDTKAQ
ncbi:MAG: cyclophilin-like fold protein [Methylophilaceae bacterium]